jgi:hypothetical protein
MGKLAIPSAFISVASVGAEVAIKRFQLAQKVDLAGQEARILGNEISALSYVLNTLGNTLLHTAESSTYFSHCLEIFQELNQKCYDIFSQISGLLEDLHAVDSKHQDGGIHFRSRIRLVFGRPKVLLHRATIESYKSTLLLSIAGWDLSLNLRRSR